MIKQPKLFDKLPKGQTPILDVCCGGKMMYWDKNDPRVTFCDIRKEEIIIWHNRTHEISPDIQCDFTNLPFPDESFQMVVFDPPHLIGKDSGWLKLKYGHLEKDWKPMITNGFSECFRVLEKGGILIFKWSEHDIPLTEVLKCTNVKPIFGQRTGIKAGTIWCCFMKE